MQGSLYGTAFSEFLKVFLCLSQSKGGILSKACEYIKELRQSNLKLGEDIGTLDRLRIDNQLLRQEVCLYVLAWDWSCRVITWQCTGINC